MEKDNEMIYDEEKKKHIDICLLITYFVGQENH